MGSSVLMNISQWTVTAMSDRLWVLIALVAVTLMCWRVMELRESNHILRLDLTYQACLDSAPGLRERQICASQLARKVSD